MAKVTHLVALKACSFGGKDFFIGDEIPVEYVLNPQAQQKLGVIAIVNGDSPETPASTLSITVQNDGEELTLNPSDKGIQNVFTVLTGTVDDAEAIINEMDDNDALILLHLADSRKTVKTAVEARAKELTGEQ